jgi:HEAT repeat protein
LYPQEIAVFSPTRSTMSTEESDFVHLAQPALFDFTETSSGAVELFPSVWSALEDLTSQDSSARLSGLERLHLLNAHRLSPLVIYVLATRLNDPDLSVRVEVLKVLGRTFSSDAQGRPTAEAVNQHLTSFLAHMRGDTLLAILQTSAHAPELEAYAARLLNYCPYAGEYLAEVLLDRKADFSCRIQAARLIGLVGFLDAVPALERLEARLASRLAGQQAMPFAPPAAMDETELLPEVQKSLSQLKIS